MYDFEVAQPSTIDEVVNALTEGNAQVIAGGQTLIPTMKSRLASPTKLVSVVNVEGMAGVSVDDSSIRVGAATCHADVAASVSKSYPALSALAANIGDPAVRNRGTLGGSLANNDPAACYPAAALASAAEIITNYRTIVADEFFEGMFETRLNDNELIVAVRFPIPGRANYQKFEQPASRFALVGVFVAQYGNSVRVAVTGASESGVYRWSEAEEALSADFNRKALAVLEVGPNGLISDLHGSAIYRAHLVKVLTGRAVDAAS